MVPEFTEDALPALYLAADHASLLGQRVYSRLLQADLLLLIAAVSLGSLPATVSPNSPILGVLALVALVASMVITIVVKDRRPEREWYGARAIAESAKSLAWKYMAGAEPFLIGLAPRHIDEMFSSTLGELLENKKDLSWEPGGQESARDQITHAMCAVRLLPVAQRKEMYLRHRIDDQRRWYATKADANRASRARWFNALIAFQGAAIVIAAVSIGVPHVPSPLVGVATSIAASVLAWMQVKQYQELSQSYAVAAHELGLISAKASHINTESDFASFVADAETAMSREHTLWAARRDTY